MGSKENRSSGNGARRSGALRSALLETKRTPARRKSEGQTATQPISRIRKAPRGGLARFSHAVLGRVYGLKARLIIPYVLLTLATAMVGTFIVTRLVASSVSERFYNQIYEAGRVASDGIVRQEEVHLANLRLMAFTQGVAEAVAGREADTLQEILWPLALNNDVDAVTVVGLDGVEILTLARDPLTNRYGVFKGTDYGDQEIVQRVLAREIDEIGDKFAGVLHTRFGPYLYTSAPVRDSQNQVVGVLMVGTSLEGLITELKSQSLADIVILDQEGRPLASSFVTEGSLVEYLSLAPEEIPSLGQTVLRDLRLEERDREYMIAYAPLIVRQQPMGVLGAALPSDYVVSAEATSRNTFSLVFSLATLAVIIVGYVISQSIAKPLLKLRDISLAVAEGDLNQRTGMDRSDEIGDLAAVFDLMTFRLRRRTAQAARLYQETLQRNKELAEINARLQSTQQQLIQSEKLAAVGQLTAGIVHDVKNPLAVIKGLAEELSEDGAVNPEVAEQLKTIRDNAARAARIVTDLLKFARQSNPAMRHQDLGETVRTAVRLTDFLARKNSVRVDSQVPDSPVEATFDATQIEQVLVNLIQNAIQAMPDGGELRVRLNADQEWARIDVIDTGVGIPEKNLRRIFDPFFTTKPPGEGTGLGLSVSYGIVSDHRGRIDVKSKVGQGTTFSVFLPLRQPEPVREF
jgi:signal transduction histidine kinase